MPKLFGKLRKTPSFASTAQDSSLSSREAPSIESGDFVSHPSSKAPSIITASSRRSSTSTVHGASEGTPSHHLYARPETPTEDYILEIDSRNIQFPSLAPSDFSVDAAYRPRKIIPSHDSISTITEVDEREHSPSRDSGYSDKSNNFPVSARTDLGLQSAELCRELKTVTELSLDFLADAELQRETSRDLLAELNGKIRPFLITLDEEMSQQEENLRINLDRSTIADSRVTWLLIYNKFYRKFRTSLMEISSIYDDLENFLRLRDRGLEGLGVQEKIKRELKKNLQIMVEVERVIREERARSDRFYLV